MADMVIRFMFDFHYVLAADMLMLSLQSTWWKNMLFKEYHLSDRLDDFLDCM